jgi:hypothetical protein
MTTPTPAAQPKILTDKQILDIIANWARTTNSRFELCRAIEAAAVAAVPAAPPEGWKLVPTEPTERMICAGIEAYQGKSEESYRAMIAAAPATAEQSSMAGAAPEPYKLTRSIIHNCPALVLPQSLIEKLGNCAQIVVLKGADDAIAGTLLAALNAGIAQPVAPVPVSEWLQAETASREAIEAYNAAVRESDKYIWPGTDINAEFQVMSAAKNKAFLAMRAMYDALSRATPAVDTQQRQEGQ